MNCNLCDAGWAKDAEGHHIFPAPDMPKYGAMRWLCHEKETCNHGTDRNHICIYCGKRWTGIVGL